MQIFDKETAENITKDCQEHMETIIDAIDEYDDELTTMIDASNNLEILDHLSSTLPEEFADDIILYICDCEYTYNYEIVKEPVGNHQKEVDHKYITESWVNQSSDGGLSGDEFAGTVCIKINDSEYLKFNYSM